MDMGESGAATTLFASNIYFTYKFGYFDSSAEIRPLLHTWSLAVEEQFYIVYPIALVLFNRHARRRLLPLLGAGLLVSLGIGVWWTVRYPTPAFYLAPARGWELLMGALLALGTLSCPPKSLMRDAAGLAGLGLMGWSFLAYTEQTEFPGVAALVPCLGAALVIYAGTGGTSVVTRALAFRPLVFIGLISYSLYLWHWTLLALAREATARPLLSPLTTVVVLAASFAAATLSWRYVERPFRDRRRYTRSTVFRLGGASMAGVLALCLLATTGDGWSLRFSPSVRKHPRRAGGLRPRGPGVHAEAVGVGQRGPALRLWHRWARADGGSLGRFARGRSGAGRRHRRRGRRAGRALRGQHRMPAPRRHHGSLARTALDRLPRLQRGRAEPSPSQPGDRYGHPRGAMGRGERGDAVRLRIGRSLRHRRRAGAGGRAHHQPGRVPPRPRSHARGLEGRRQARRDCGPRARDRHGRAKGARHRADRGRADRERTDDGRVPRTSVVRVGFLSRRGSGQRVGVDPAARGALRRGALRRGAGRPHPLLRRRPHLVRRHRRRSAPLRRAFLGNGCRHRQPVITHLRHNGRRSRGGPEPCGDGRFVHLAACG
ncbi:MAG: hypothetical protein EXQ94_03880 [Alphaproteobacteria bacterium]|nr:hypothetical protein [Alphaproteobacteria bacterium]